LLCTNYINVRGPGKNGEGIGMELSGCGSRPIGCGVEGVWPSQNFCLTNDTIKVVFKIIFILYK
jgi:hypothetical protein